MSRVLVTGGAGFIGSHLCEALLARGDEVSVVDDLSTGRVENIAHLQDREDFHMTANKTGTSSNQNSAHMYDLYLRRRGRPVIKASPREAQTSNSNGT